MQYLSDTLNLALWRYDRQKGIKETTEIQNSA